MFASPMKDRARNSRRASDLCLVYQLSRSLQKHERNVHPHVLPTFMSTLACLPQRVCPGVSSLAYLPVLTYPSGPSPLFPS